MLPDQEEGSSLQCWTLCEPHLPMLGASPDNVAWDEDIQEYGLVEVKTASQAITAGLRTFEQVIWAKVFFRFYQRGQDRHQS